MKTLRTAGREWLSLKLGHEHSLRRGEYLFRKDDPTVGIYEIEMGQVRLSRVDQAGHEVVMHVAREGDLVAEASLFSEVYNCDAVAVTDARARLYPRKELLAAFRLDPEASAAFAARIAHELMSLRTRLELRNIRSATGRVRSFLALNAGPDGRTVVLHGTLKDLSAELGLSHESLYRTLHKLESAGEIARAEGKIILKRKQGV